MGGHVEASSIFILILLSSLMDSNDFFIFTISHNSLCYDTTNRVYLVSPPTPPVMLFRQDAPLNFDLLLSALSLGWGGGAKTPNTVGFTVIQALNNDMNLQSFIWTMHLLKVK